MRARPFTGYFRREHLPGFPDRVFRSRVEYQRDRCGKSWSTAGVVTAGSRSRGLLEARACCSTRLPCGEPSDGSWRLPTCFPWGHIVHIYSRYTAVEASALPLAALRKRLMETRDSVVYTTGSWELGYRCNLRLLFPLCLWIIFIAILSEHKNLGTFRHLYINIDASVQIHKT